MGEEQEIRPASDNDVVIFVSAASGGSGFTPHSKIEDKVREKVGDLRENYHEILAQIAAMVGESNETKVGSLHLTELSIALGFDASGKLGFIAGGVEVGATATVTVTFAK